MSNELIDDDLNDEIKALTGKSRQKGKTEKEYQTHYEMGLSAGWRGEHLDAMPNFKRAIRASAWQKGHADGLEQYRLHQEKNNINKPGLKHFVDFMREALAKKT